MTGGSDPDPQQKPAVESQNNGSAGKDRVAKNGNAADVKSERKRKKKVRKDKKGRKSKSRPSPRRSLRSRLLYAFVMLLLVIYFLPGEDSESVPERAEPEIPDPEEDERVRLEEYERTVREHDEEEKYAKHFQNNCPIDLESSGHELRFKGYSFFENDEYYTGILKCTSEDDLCEAAGIQAATCKKLECERPEISQKCALVPYECIFSTHGGEVKPDGKFRVSPIAYKCKVLNGKFCPPCQLSYTLEMTSIFGFNSVVRNTIALFLVATSVALCLKRQVSAKKSPKEHQYNSDDEYASEGEHEEEAARRKEIQRKKKVLKAKLKAAALIKKIAKKEARKHATKNHGEGNRSPKRNMEHSEHSSSLCSDSRGSESDDYKHRRSHKEKRERTDSSDASEESFPMIKKEASPRKERLLDSSEYEESD
eukprot:CAMPEP_0184025410 /NCGR_PEP_ID=MMETSP0954-20121128/12789_1 /TAXON_ID=627963 /ORGANISM="Aplanochytrium sp, Strain PBS07" /LENGTH=423 /DNA_ID=CAMNT_0026309179 /DNA_START=213 /DNA_END=1484 /DNA_ORIENTATION=-